jgi:hypothetical protein
VILWQGVGIVLGVVLVALRGGLRLAWWLLRAVWWLAWRLALVAVAALVLPFSRRLAGRVVRRALSAKGGRGVTRDSGQRTTSSAASAKIVLRPESAQRVVTSTYGEQRYATTGVSGPELLTMLCGAAGCGKTEIELGLWRAQYDGVPFGGEGGLPSVRGKRKLLLTEMAPKTLRPALERWGFAEAPRNWLHDKRLRYLPLRSGPGGYIDVLYAERVLAPRVTPDGLVTPDWPHVVDRVTPLALRGDYDEVVVDSLAEWLGDDSQGNMLPTLAACRQITRHGPGVTLLHHTPRSDPRRPRGSGAIDGKLDIGWSVYGLGPGYAPRSLHDAVRVFAPWKTRFPEDTPREPLVVERVWAGPGSGEPPRYRLLGGRAGQRDARPSQEGGAPAEERTEERSADPYPGLGAQARQVRDALAAAGGRATVPALAQATGLARQRVNEAKDELALAGLLTVTAERVPAPGGGPPATVYRLVREDGAAQPAGLPERPRLWVVGGSADAPGGGAGPHVASPPSEGAGGSVA